MRPRGSIAGSTIQPTTLVASGVWNMIEQAEFRRLDTWPRQFDPSALSGLQLWLDASDSATLFDATSGGSLVAANGVVRRWQDKSGNARHVTGSAGPTRKTSVVNSKDALLCANSLLTNSSINLSGASSASLFAVIQFANSGSFQIGCGFGTASSYGGLLLSGNRSASRYSVDVGNNIAFSETYAFGGTVGGSVMHIAGIYSSPSVTIYQGGVSSGTASFSSGLNSASGFTVGSYFSTSTLPLSGYVCEIVYLNRAATALEIASMQNYFSTKWGV